MGRLLIRLGIGLIFAVFGLFSYFTNVTDNPITGEKQRIQLSPQQEIVIGKESSAEMAQQYGGLAVDNILQQYIDKVGNSVITSSTAKSAPYPFEFHLLRDRQTINAFALPGGQIFITQALLSRLNSEAQLAGVLGHEVGHVVARHGAEHLARQQLGTVLVNAIGIAASEDPSDGRQAAIIAQVVNQMVNLKYDRDDELESDRLGLRFMTEAGYSPQGLLELMEILNSANGSGGQPEFLSTHPNPDNRVEQLVALINENYPQGIPKSLIEGRQNFTQLVSPRL
ncbi:M48 family metalloprotease [Myxosarcina sp. GI1]|uniref:M48 family metalloprotease n=1 Tax=Myxosarcina sp. GI1 TaxID=1541065 RepID=UPI00055F19F2|nr:M48 family metalloprotease [Myxosarcina sp. GI1]